MGFTFNIATISAIDRFMPSFGDMVSEMKRFSPANAKPAAGWGEDDMQIWLRFYASDKERAKHQQEWPNDTIPAKEKLPYNRDWRLPKGPF
jgi:hypothetical protein